jgi:hypothetical protein
VGAGPAPAYAYDGVPAHDIWRSAIAQSAMATPLIVILYEQLAFMLRNSLNIVHS